jgi:hypothetical protein
VLPDEAELWSSTTMVLVEAHGGGQTGLGYSYSDASVAALVRSKLAPVVTGMDALAPAAAWRSMFAQLGVADRAGSSTAVTRRPAGGPPSAGAPRPAAAPRTASRGRRPTGQLVISAEVILAQAIEPKISRYTPNDSSPWLSAVVSTGVRRIESNDSHQCVGR